jgi:acetolactate synthase-1/2/3 large subunit
MAGRTSLRVRGISEHIQPQLAIKTLYEETNGRGDHHDRGGPAPDVGGPVLQVHKTRSFSSLGLGHDGLRPARRPRRQGRRPDRTVVDIDGDGSFMMNVQELATAVMEKIPVKVMLLNNQHLGMVVQWEDILYEGVRGQTVLGHPDNIGGPDNVTPSIPTGRKSAKGFGVKCRRVWKKEELREAVREMIDHDGPYVLDVVVPYTEHVMPFIPAGASAKDILIKSR